MPINDSNIVGLFFLACLIGIALWRLYIWWHSYTYLQRYGRIIWAKVTDIKTEMRTIPISTRQIMRSEDFLYLTWKDARSENEHTFKVKVPASYTPEIGEMLPIRIGSDGFQNYRLDLREFQSRPRSLAKKRQHLKVANAYDISNDSEEEYEVPKTSYPLQIPEQK